MTEKRMEFVKKYIPPNEEVSDEALRLLVETFPESPEVLAWQESLRLAEDHRRLEEARLKNNQTWSEIAAIFRIKIPAIIESLEQDAPERIAPMKRQTDELLQAMEKRRKRISRILKDNRPDIKPRELSELPPFLENRQVGNGKPE